MRLSITAAAFLFCSCAQGFTPSLSSSRKSSAVVQNAISSQWTMDEPVPEVSFVIFFFDHSTCHDESPYNRIRFESAKQQRHDNNLIRTI
jgi:NRPS condensation-like uncharacterized protein